MLLAHSLTPSRAFTAQAEDLPVFLAPGRAFLAHSFSMLAWFVQQHARLFLPTNNTPWCSYIRQHVDKLLSDHPVKAILDSFLGAH
jgi:hypothetical protein